MFWTPKINSAEIINKLINTMGYCSVLCLCTSHRFRKRKQAGNALMMNVEIPNTPPAVQAAPLMSNLYLKQAIQVGHTTSHMVAVKWFSKCKQIPKTCIEEAYSTSDGLQECCVVFQAEIHTKMVNVPQQTSLKKWFTPIS